jgi:RNA methyltransferase, TrmH family
VPAAAGYHSPHVKAARLLHTKKHRTEARCFLVEGPTLLNAALDAGVKPTEVFVARAPSPASDAAARRAEAAGAAAHEVDARTLESLAQTRTPQGVIAKVPFLDEPLEALARRLPAAGPVTLLVLDDLDDPGNAGTLVRSAEAFGAAAVCFGPHSVEPYNDKLVRASMGALFRIPIARYRDWPQLQAALAGVSIRIVGAAAQAPDIRSMDLGERVALVLGNERQGIEALPARALDQVVGVPQQPAGDSLNVAIAGSILLYELARKH